MANTKLLLLEDVGVLGRSGDVVSVRPGYARNFLVPEGHAVVATKQTLQRRKQLQEERAKRAAADRTRFEAVAKQLEGAVVETLVKVDPEGHMYGSVTAADIAQLVHTKFGMEFDKHYIQIPHALKKTGTHQVALKLPEGVEGSITVKISSEFEAAHAVVIEAEPVKE